MRLGTLDALRGLAALAVTWFHMTNTYDPASWARKSGDFGWTGVDAFFVISGFVIPYSLYRADYRFAHVWRFLARRLVRLEPPYLLSIAAVIALQFLSEALPGFRGKVLHYDPLMVASHLLYLIPFTRFDWINVVYWSLAYEFAFYILMALFFPLLSKRHLAWSVLAVFAAWTAKHGLTGQWDSRVLLFALGISTARHFMGRDSLRAFFLCLGTTALAIAWIGDLTSAVAGTATALVIAFARFKPPAPLVALGSISYSLYLLHVPVGGRVINLGRRFVAGSGQELLLSLVALAISLAAAAIFYRLVEVPATRLAHRIRY